jgi:hypothetical protein
MVAVIQDCVRAYCIANASLLNYRAIVRNVGSLTQPVKHFGAGYLIRHRFPAVDDHRRRNNGAPSCRRNKIRGGLQRELVEAGRPRQNDLAALGIQPRRVSAPTKCRTACRSHCAPVVRRPLRGGYLPGSRNSGWLHR